MRAAAAFVLCCASNTKGQLASVAAGRDRGDDDTHAAASDELAQIVRRAGPRDGSSGWVKSRLARGQRCNLQRFHIRIAIASSWTSSNHDCPSKPSDSRMESNQERAAPLFFVWRALPACAARSNTRRRPNRTTRGQAYKLVMMASLSLSATCNRST